MRIRLVSRRRVQTDIEGIRVGLERLEGGRDILPSPDFQRDDFEAEGAGRRLNLAHFQYGEAISNIAQDRQAAQTRDHLAQDFKALGSQIGSLTRQSSDVATRSRQTGDKPASTGSPAAANTIGMTVVACFAATTARVPAVTMISTLSRTNSAAISAKRSSRPSPQRYSIVMVRPSIRPSSRNRCTKAAVHSVAAERVLRPKKPMVGSSPTAAHRRKRPRGRCTAEKRDEFPPPHAPPQAQAWSAYRARLIS